MKNFKMDQKRKCLLTASIKETPQEREFKKKKFSESFAEKCTSLELKLPKVPLSSFSGTVKRERSFVKFVLFINSKHMAVEPIN